MSSRRLRSDILLFTSVDTLWGNEVLKGSNGAVSWVLKPDVSGRRRGWGSGDVGGLKEWGRVPRRGTGASQRGMLGRLSSAACDVSGELGIGRLDWMLRLAWVVW